MPDYDKPRGEYVAPWQPIAWSSKKRGNEKRQQILAYHQQNPHATLETIAKAVNLSVTQVKRHRTNLVIEGRWLSTLLIFFAIGPIIITSLPDLDPTMEEISYLENWEPRRQTA